MGWRGCRVGSSLGVGFSEEVGQLGWRWVGKERGGEGRGDSVK